ncbi:molybdopterin cofactor biosynthetic protein [Paecilomyces variotii No. 5]|uniref:Molybdopterin cofactor biosynthetic protein n=1 Tax=Byssochlamys spectabilis (strain No. 5 / NBRC 109023) TaxID=1356009 RepID=V5GE25_BYSSN|nr:molybdopterin cofactor biosynthetic protein [Paecilomyces variotii No. 5]
MTGPLLQRRAASLRPSLRHPARLNGVWIARGLQNLAGRRSSTSTATAPELKQVHEDLSASPAYTPVHTDPPHTTPPPVSSARRSALKTAKPFSEFLTDTFNRQHDYLRISITERCNLRCLYCMPEEGVPLSPPPELLTTPEIVYLSSLFVSQGVTKIRLTGGEPTVRKDIVPLMQAIGDLRRDGLKELCLTTNGISLHRKLDAMVDAGLTGINLSLDTLDPFQYQIMTRRKGFDAVMKSIDRILEMNKTGAGIKLKVNCVVMRGLNDREIIPFVELGRDKPIEVRFIEYMPFDGNKWSQGKMFSYQEMLAVIRNKYPSLETVKGHKNDTSKTYRVPGFEGRVGFITSMTHNFCGTCNRLRITSDGNLKVCLFGNSEVSLRDLIRKANNGQPVDDEAMEALNLLESGRMAAHIHDNGGIVNERERELLDVIGMAVKRKKAKHAGMGELENMKNRPMILIDELSGLVHKTALPDSSVTTSRPSAIPNRPWTRVPAHLLAARPLSLPHVRHYSSHNGHNNNGNGHRGRYNGLKGSSSVAEPSYSIRHFRARPNPRSPDSEAAKPVVSLPTASDTHLPHLTPSQTVHMTQIQEKPVTKRLATAKCFVNFSNSQPYDLLKEGGLTKKGDVFSVARIAGITAAKKTPDIVPLCHPSIGITGVEVNVILNQPPLNPKTHYRYGSITVIATVTCLGRTGVEMEAMTAVMGAALTVYDMLKAVDKGMLISKVQLLEKMGGKSGHWVREREIGDLSHHGRLGRYSEEELADQEEDY